MSDHIFQLWYGPVGQFGALFQYIAISLVFHQQQSTIWHDMIFLHSQKFLQPDEVL